MGGDALKIEIEGLARVQQAMTRMAQELHGSTMIEAMRDCTLKVLADAMRNAPVHTGRLRASIYPEVTTAGKTVMGIVGSNVEYAPFMEFGTRPHFPPLEPIQRWAELKFQVDAARAYVIAKSVIRAIGTKGLAARNYLGKAVEANGEYIREKIGRGVEAVISNG